MPSTTSLASGCLVIGTGIIFAFSCYPAEAAQKLEGHVPRAVADATMMRHLPQTSRLNLAIGLPLRNSSVLDQLLNDIANPSRPNYRTYLTPEQFTEQFGPAEGDYQALITFAESRGLAVTATHPNRMILDVAGTVADVEKAFHLNMIVYQHSVRGQFYAPDREPSLDVDVKALDISGLDNFELPHPMALKSLPLSQAKPFVTGSGPAGLFIGKDFRAAYAPGVTLDGSGQVLGLLEFDGFYPADLQANFARAGLPPVPTQTVLVDGFNGAPGSANIEVMLDIAMAGYMAPGIAKIIVYEGLYPNDVLNRMATDNLAQQLSSSWGFSPINATTEQIFKQYLAQGQSFYQASGDSGAYRSGVMPPSDNPNVTVVGGTSLTTSGLGGPWQSEKTWTGSGGGISTAYPMPAYQQGIAMGANGGSLTMRNIPDVALTADVQMFLICNNGQGVAVGGTSAAAPLWAGFNALVNQKAAANGKPRIGFVNPALYSIGKGSNYLLDFHDLSLGSNGFATVTGYDLATGWGSPAGQHLIDDLSGVSSGPSFSLSSSISTVSINPGSNAKFTLTISAQNGFTGIVVLTASGLPAGVTAVFSPASTMSGSTVTFSAAASALAGTALITLTGTSGALKSSVAITLSVSVPNFSFAASAGAVNVPAGASAATTLSVSALNGFSGTVVFSVSGVPPGVTASFSAGAKPGESVLTLAAGSAAVSGKSTVTILATSGSLIHTVAIALTVVVPGPGTALVSLAPVYNINAIATDGSTFAPIGIDGGLNGIGSAYSGNLLEGQLTVAGTTFYFGPSDGPDAVTGKTIALNGGQFATIRLLATAVNGNQAGQTFTVTYSDGTTTSLIQNLSDWFSPQNYPGESKALTMAYRNTSGGATDNRTFALYAYSFNLNPAKKVTGITLPNNRNVVVLAVSLAGAAAPAVTPVSVNLMGAFDTPGIASDGRPFKGGLDGVGYAFSGNLLGTSRTVNSAQFTFGPLDLPDAVSGSPRDILLPPGTFSSLQILATGVNGSQLGQIFKVTYTDGTSTAFVQSLSDWFKPQAFKGETNAIVMPRRNSSRGLPDNGPFYLYGYTFPLVKGKTVLSFTLPPNANVKLLAATLMP